MRGEKKKRGEEDFPNKKLIGRPGGERAARAAAGGKKMREEKSHRPAVDGIASEFLTRLGQRWELATCSGVAFVALLQPSFLRTAFSSLTFSPVCACRRVILRKEIDCIGAPLFGSRCSTLM